MKRSEWSNLSVAQPYLQIGEYHIAEKFGGDERVVLYPGDVWAIPNVKSNHVEKTEHPCQFPVELIERLVISLTREDDWVFDPFLGTGTSVIAAIRHGRRGAGAEVMPKYVDLARNRIAQEMAGTLRTRPVDRPVYDPVQAGNALTRAPWINPEPGSSDGASLFREVDT